MNIKDFFKKLIPDILDEKPLDDYDKDLVEVFLELFLRGTEELKGLAINFNKILSIKYLRDKGIYEISEQKLSEMIEDYRSNFENIIDSGSIFLKWDKK
jgi:hypothetical protein